jgi:hydrogenase/urease accessory protein HupE
MVAMALVLVALTHPHPAEAHTVGLSRGDYRLQGEMLTSDIALSQRELAMSMPALDLNHDGSIDRDELKAASSAIVRTFVDGLAVTSDGEPCPGSLDDSSLVEDGVVIRSHYVCRKPPGRIRLDWSFLAALGDGHRHVARVTIGSVASDLLVQRGGSPQTFDAAGAMSRGSGTAWAMFELGVGHILTGADHLLFLLGLILIGSSARSLALVISAFTVAHSITLALATLSVVTPSPRLVEPLIALSIAYVGVENLFVKDAGKRWRITFPFGLVHGFGFAGALREIALPRAQIPVALVSFNVGVEAGQLGVLAIVLPLVFAARRAPLFRERGTKLASLGIAFAGMVWFVVRIAAAA